jgi:hypothetical protein
MLYGYLRQVIDILTSALNLKSITTMCLEVSLKKKAGVRLPLAYAVSSLARLHRLLSESLLMVWVMKAAANNSF